MSDQEWDINRVAQQLAIICERNGIDFLNPTDAFRLKASKFESVGMRLYFHHDGHWNVHGHQYAGELLADYISSTYLK